MCCAALQIVVVGKLGRWVDVAKLSKDSVPVQIVLHAAEVATRCCKATLL